MAGRCCARHKNERPCSCAMGNLYRYVEPVVLYLLQVKGRAYGYELLSDLKDHALTDSTIDPGVLYRTLRQLERNLYVISSWDMSGAGPARRLYELTPAGQRHLGEWLAVLDNLAHAMSRFAAEVRLQLQKIPGPELQPGSKPQHP